MTITLDMEPILQQLELIIIANEADNSVLTERLDVLTEIVQALASNNALLSMWNIGLMAVSVALLFVIIFAIAWRR
jgi:hypothetical protein